MRLCYDQSMQGVNTLYIELRGLMGIWRLGNVALSQTKRRSSSLLAGACSSPFPAVCADSLLVLTYSVNVLKITMFTTSTPSLETIPLAHGRVPYTTATWLSQQNRLGGGLIPPILYFSPLFQHQFHDSYLHIDILTLAGCSLPTLCLLYRH